MLFHAIIGLKSMDADGLKSYGYDEQLISLLKNMGLVQPAKCA